MTSPMFRPQPVRRPRSWRARIARWLTGHHKPRHYSPDCPLCVAELTHHTWRI